MEEMLVEEVVPRLRNAARSIPKIGHEDDEEIVQDATLMAARMMDSAEQAGRTFTAGNVSYYAARAARSGRRSYYTGRSDALSPGCQIERLAVIFLFLKEVSRYINTPGVCNSTSNLRAYRNAARNRLGLGFEVVLSIFGSGGGVRWWLLLIFLAGCVAAGAEPKRVMLIHSFGRDFAPYNTFSAVLRSELVSHYSGPVDVLEVTLDSARSGDTVQEELLVDYLASLSSLRRLDLVIPIGGPAVRFAQGHRERFFSGTPMLISGADERHVQQTTLTRNDAIVAAQIEPSRVVQTILQLLPDTKNIVVVAGASPLEKFWIKELRTDFQPLADRVTFQWVDELSFDEMLERCAKLPPQTAIFYALLAVDAKGIPQWDEGTVNRLHQVANAPIFGVFESQLGRGIVGGPLMDMQEMARNTAQVASRILLGEVAGDIRTAPQMMGDPQFDWRELRRWKIPESNLPPGSTLKFRQPDFWERYRWPVAGAALLGLLQAALIVGLLVNRKRRIRAEAEATLIADISAKFVNLPASEVDREIREAERRICELLDLDLAGLWQWSHEAEPSLTLTHLHGEVKLPPPEGIKAAEFFPWFQEAIAAGRVVEFSSLERLPDEAGRDRESFRTFGIKAGLALPLSVGGEPPIGAFELNATRKEHSWSEGQIARLELIAQIFTNALARKRADQALRESELRLSLAAEAAEAGLWVLDWDKQEFWITDRARRIFGYPSDGMVDMARFEKTIHAQDLDRIHKLIAHSVSTGELLHVEYRIRHNDGGTRWIASTGRPFFKANGDPERLLGLSMDITVKRHAEMEAIELRSTLAHTGRVTLLGQLASALAHELSQPLGAILRNAEAAEIMLQDASPDFEEMRAIIDDIQRDDHRAGQVIDKLRSLLKNGSLEVQPLDLTEVIGGVLSLVQPDATSRHVLISSSLPVDLPMASGDKIHLQQVLINLLVNAMDVLVGSENGQRSIWIRARQTDDKMVEVRVCDNGPGIPEGQFERLFEPFFTTKKTGMGMGLPVSKTIIEAHKGRLWAENRPEGGACFCFTVPIAEIPV